MWKKKQEKIESDEIELSDNVADLHDLFIPDGLLETKDYLYLGPENYVRTFVVSVYPREIYLGWLDDLFSIEGISLTTYIEPVPDDKVAKNLKKKLDSVLTEIYSREKTEILQTCLNLQQCVMTFCQSLLLFKLTVTKCFI